MVIDADGGALDFTYDFRSRTYASVNAACPLVDGDRVFLTASYGTGTAGLLTEAEGGFKELWKNRHIGMEFSNLLLHEGHLYAVDGRSDRMGEVICIDPATGKELSRTPIELEEEFEKDGETKTLPMSIGQGSLLYADGRVLCLGTMATCSGWSSHRRAPRYLRAHGCSGPTKRGPRP